MLYYKVLLVPLSNCVPQICGRHEDNNLHCKLCRCLPIGLAKKNSSFSSTEVLFIQGLQFILRFILRLAKSVLLLSMMSSEKRWDHAGFPGQLCKITTALFVKWFPILLQKRNSLKKKYLRGNNNGGIFAKMSFVHPFLQCQSRY